MSFMSIFWMSSGVISSSSKLLLSLSIIVSFVFFLFKSWIFSSETLLCYYLLCDRSCSDPSSEDKSPSKDSLLILCYSARNSFSHSTSLASNLSEIYLIIISNFFYSCSTQFMLFSSSVPTNSLVFISFAFSKKFKNLSCCSYSLSIFMCAGS